MIPLLTADEMRALENVAISEWGIPSLVLQEHAAMGALALIPARVPLAVLAGPGNNGGDALALARLAKGRGTSVSVWTLDPEPSWRGDAALQARLWEGLGGKYCFAADPRTVLNDFQGWVVDGLFGLGTRLPLPVLAAAWVEAIQEKRSRQHSLRVLALDLPSGLDPSCADLDSPVLRADLTACFGHLKRCHGLRPAKDFCGEISVVPLPLSQAPQSLLSLNDQPRLSSLSSWNTHKRDLGHVAIRAGSLGMSGAAVLAALGALRAGAGLVSVLTDAEIRAEVAGQVPEAMVQVWNGQVPEGVDVLLVGPGGVTDVPSWDGPLVLDASALRSGEGPQWLQRPGTVLTPHPGEFARLFATQPLARETSARLAAIRGAGQGPGVVVLKGAQTLIAGGGDAEVWVNPTGHPGLSTGGTGDFLAGMVAARTALRRRGATPRQLKEDAAEAVWFHGAAADRLGPGPLLVRDLGPSLSQLMKEWHDTGR